MNYFLEDQERDLIKLCVLLLKGKFHGSAHAHLSTCRFFEFLPGHAVSSMQAKLSDMHMIMSALSKNQSTHSPGSHLINLCANSCKFINKKIKSLG